MTDKPKSAGGDFSLAVLRDLGNQLQIKAEKMRLLARAEEGLGDDDYNPYSTTIKTRQTSEMIADMKIKTEANTKHGGRSKLAPSDKEAHVPSRIKPEGNIPVSAARQRRRNKETTGTAAQTKIDIKHYRPGYTWNRGGRMKEIRIRYLARKFLFMWKRKVFGRVTPSQARNHYRRRLLRLTFRVWHDMWWELRKEWRLEVRAECHHRYVLWKKTFQAWRDFIVKQRIKNTKLALAEQHASIKLQRKCMMGWYLYVHSRRKKNEMKKQALEHHNRHLIRICWQLWTSRHDLILHRQHMESVALQFWAYRIQAQYWLVWQSKLCDRKASVMKHYRAVRHYNTSIVKKYLHAWVTYWNRRQRKIQEKHHCERLYNKTLLSRAYVTWYRAFQFRERLHERQDRINILATVFQKRRAFVHWKHYIEQQREKYEMLAEAENHYRTKLLRTGLSSFRLCVVQRRLKVMRNEMAAQLRYKQLTRMGWLTWLSRCENKEELLIVTQSHLAWKHYRLVLLRKCFDQLQLYTEWRQHRKGQYARADAHFYMQEMPKYMFRLKVFVQLMRNKRENSQNAIEFRRENTLARYFYTWVSQYEFSKEYRMNERMAILQYDNRLCKKMLLSWKQKTADVLQEAENMGLAAEHHNEVLCRRYLSTWRTYIQNMKKCQRQDIEASRYYCRKNMKKCIQAWIKYTRLRREKKRKSERARNHYHRKLCGKMVAMWLHYVDTQRTIHARVERLYKRKCSILLCESFHRWRANIAEQKMERHTELVTDRHYTLKILAKVFTAWHRYSAIHAYKKSETRQWVESARQHLDSKVLGIYFTKWKEHHVEHVDISLKYARAVDYHNVNVKVKVLQTWKSFAKESIRKSLLKKQSDWFLTVRLTARCFITWKHAHNAAEVEKQKTSLALWHWCLNLHRKVLMAWFEYTQHCKHKKSRVQAAMERRRSCLIKNGLTQWLRVADDMSAWRKQLAVQQQTKSVYDTYQVVLKCGLHWKAWASKRCQARGGPKPLNSKNDGRGIHMSSKGDKSGMKPDMSCPSLASTPRFPVSLFNTPREPTEIPPMSARTQVVSELPAPVMTASPGRTRTAHVPGTQLGGNVQARARPRQPSFLMESLKRAGLFVHDTYSVNEQEENKPVSQVPVQKTEIERLNLSNLTGNVSDLDSERTLTPHNTHYDQPVINSVRSDQTVSQLSGRVPFQNYNNREPVSEGAQHHGKWQEDQLQSDMNVKEHVPSNADENKPRTRFFQNQPNISKVTLMTPADFLGKVSRAVTQSGNIDSKLTPRTLPTVDSAAVSQCTSVASTPRVLCQNSNHNHPLSETRSFRITDFQEQITPRLTILTTHREQLSAPEIESNSTQVIQKEIVAIRNRLKSYEEKKKKLRRMQKQLKQLSDWLRDIEVKGHGKEDDDVINAKQEVQELTSDVDVLKRSVEEEKSQCANLVERVKVLTAQLTT